MNASGRAAGGRALNLIMLLSGAAGLGYELVWTRLLSVALGHEVVAVLAVIAAFFAGLALGAFTLNAALLRSRRPVRWYAALELIIGLWALLLLVVAPRLAPAIAAGLGPAPPVWLHWSVAFGGSALLLLPATMAMGATLPAMARIAACTDAPGRHVSGLYAANTLGAVVGTLLTTFLLAPSFGNTRTVVALAVCNLFCAVAILWLGRRDPWLDAAAPSSVPTTVGTGSVPLGVLVATGLLGVGFEVLVVRVLAQVLENTFYTFGAVLAVYLLGTAVGAAIYQLRQPPRDFRSALDRLVFLTAAACFASASLLWFGGDLHSILRELLGSGQVAAIAAETLLAAAVLLAPTLAMGALFAHLAEGAGRQLGRALAANTLGAALAPPVFGLLVLPGTGAKAALLLVVAGYLLLLTRAALFSPRGIGAFTVAASCLLFVPPLHHVNVPEGGRLLRHMDGTMAAVSVIEDADGTRQLRIDERFTMGGTATRFSDRRQAHIPLLLHPAPRESLFLGLGPGMTFAAAAAHPGLTATGVELVPEILPLLPLFDPVFGDLAERAPGLSLVASDARRYVSASDARYDVIIADLFHPSRDGAGSLYTVEHFGHVRAALRPGGLFCQWLPLYQLDLPTLRLITRTFLRVFPDARAYLGHLSLGMPIVALVGHADAAPLYPSGWLEARLAQSPSLAGELQATRLDTDFALLGSLLATSEGLRRFAGEGPLNTDDLPLVTYRAPGFVYELQAPPAARLIELIHALAAPTSEALHRVVIDDGFRDRLAQYLAARDAFLAAGVGVRPDISPRRLLDETREPLLRIVRMSPDFEPAYRPLLGLANALHASDPEVADELLRELEAAAPERPEAGKLRTALFGG
jgi:spermidine synthase